ncbi:SDR family oxidoreductase [Mucilaginibacter sp. CAU 1740]|uniref:SDR family oxidoreductase n=1 Tax=Mucilaginibacter sp. CAU 1740 TaxID=3140365 RepID=UPI00325A58E3
MKTIFITGASSGLGKATAMLFLTQGWRVIATMRDPGAAKEFQRSERLIILPLDVTDAEQIKLTVEQLTAEFDVDVVFNNAGYGISGPLEAVTEFQLQRQIETNLLGPIRVTQAFIPYFRKKGSGLFITTTSVGGLVGFPFSSLYHATKWGLEGWSESMSFELRKLGISIKTVAPGAIQTDFINRSYDWALHPAYQHWMDRFTANVSGTVFAPPEKIAQVVFEAATDGKNQLRYLAGDDTKMLYNKRLELGNDGFNKFMEAAFLSDK